MATPQAHHIQGAKNSSRPPVWVAATCMGGKLEPRDSESNPGTAVTWDVGTPARPHSHHAPSPPSLKCKHDGDTHTARGYLFRAGAPPHEPSPPPRSPGSGTSGDSRAGMEGDALETRCCPHCTMCSDSVHAAPEAPGPFAHPQPCPPGGSFVGAVGWDSNFQVSLG